MAKPKVGQILDPEKEYVRDAIHVPIMEIISAGILTPGQKICIINGLAFPWIFNNHLPMVGVVDPYIMDDVQSGDKFYLFLKPESTTKLWHNWIHPLVDKKV